MRRFSDYAKASATTVVAGAFLLPWQWLALCWFAGIWATRHPEPAVPCILVVLFMLLQGGMKTLPQDPGADVGERLQRLGVLGRFVRFTLPVLALLAAAAGYGTATLRTPDAVQVLPAFVEERKPVIVTGTVVAVQPALQNRLQVILDDLWCEDGNERIPLSGHMVWTWDSPVSVDGVPDGVRIGPGQQVTLQQRVKPVRGFLNEGTWDSGQYWRDRGVLWRMWSRGDGKGLVVSGEPDRLWQWREAVRTRVISVPIPASGSERAAPSESVHGRTGNADAAGRADQDGDDAGGADGLSGKTGRGNEGGADSWQTLVPEYGNPASVIPALLFGDRFHLTYARMDQLSLAAVSHSLALSGMHLGVMGGLGWCLAWLAGLVCPALYLRIPRPKLAVLCAAPLVAGYVWLGGASPSLLRAALMFACWGVLLWCNRPRVLLDGVFMAVGLISLWDPLALFDLRLQLSALAVLSLALFLPLLLPLFSAWADRLLTRRSSVGAGAQAPFMVRMMARLRMGAAGLLAANVSIQLGMLPVVIWNFNTTSPWFLLNLIWLPVLGLWVLPLCLSGLLLSFLWGAAAAAGFHAALWPVTWLFGGLDWLQQVGWLVPHVAMRPHWLSMAGYWMLLVGCALHMQTAGAEAARRIRTGIAVGALLLCLAPAGRMVAAMQDDVSLSLLDVGQGQSILLALPHEERILVDGGGFGLSGFDTGKSIVTPVVTLGMPPRLDVVANTHPDTDHLQGLLYPLRYFSVAAFAGNGDKASRSNAAQLRRLRDETGIEPATLAAGDVLYEKNGLRLEVLHPPREKGRASSNNAALVLRLVRDGHGLALLMGDLEKEGIRTLLASGQELSAEVLVLPHHGARSSLAPALYDAVRPRFALAGTGYLNQWKFPSQAVQDALKEEGIALYHTAADGQVRVLWRKGQPAAVETYRAGPGVAGE